MSNGNYSAFPVPHFARPDGDIAWGEMGVNKRELFAAMAMQGLCAAEDQADPWQDDKLAAWAVRRADALLAELAK